MEVIKQFLFELDQLWKPTGDHKIVLSIIGSAALLLQTDYTRGTKDSDVMETKEITPEVQEQLLRLGDKGTKLHTKHRIYIDIVNCALPFLPQSPKYHRVTMQSPLQHFEILALDVTDVMVSKMKRFHAEDVGDIRAMIEAGHVTHQSLVKRFELAIDAFLMDARASEIPKYIQNLNTVERDFFSGTSPSKFDLPDYLA